MKENHEREYDPNLLKVFLDDLYLVISGSQGLSTFVLLFCAKTQRLTGETKEKIRKTWTTFLLES